MKKLNLIFILLIITVGAFSKSLVVECSFDVFIIDDISNTITHRTDGILKGTTTYKVEYADNVGGDNWKIIAKSNNNEKYLFEFYTNDDNKSFVLKYHFKRTNEKKVQLFETARGKINLDDFYNFQLSQVDDNIKSKGLTGDAARGYRNEFIKHLDDMKSGNITKLNSDRTFSVVNGKNYKDYRGWKAKIKKGSWLKGTSDQYVMDDDYGRNEAIGDLSRSLSEWNIYKETDEGKEWVRIKRAEVKSISIE